MNTTKSLPKAWEAIDTKLNKGSYNGSASDLKTLIDGKEPTINKKSGFNLDKSDAINSANSNTLATSTAVKTAYDKGLEGVNVANTKLTRGNLPAGLADSKSLYDLLENNGGLNMDPNLLYLNDAGTKTKGKVYFDKNKKGLFECIETTSSTTNSTTYFVDISNKASSDRLNNLIPFTFSINNTDDINKLYQISLYQIRKVIIDIWAKETVKIDISKIKFGHETDLFISRRSGSTILILTGAFSNLHDENVTLQIKGWDIAYPTFHIIKSSSGSPCIINFLPIDVLVQ